MEDRQAFESPLVHTDVSGALPSWDATDAHILDRAAELIIARGTAALTIAELARAAQVSRPTIYRRWSSADDVVRAALVRRTVLLIAGAGHVQPDVGVPQHLPPALRVRAVELPKEATGKDYCAEFRQQQRHMRPAE